MKPELVILIGIPASGKSTWANEKVVDPSWVKSGRDDFRYGMKNIGYCSGKIEGLITKLQYHQISEALAAGFSVIVDNTSVEGKFIDEFIQKFKNIADISYKIFYISKNNAISRDLLRKNTGRMVGESVISRMYDKFTNLTNTFDFNKLPEYDKK